MDYESIELILLTPKKNRYSSRVPASTELIIELIMSGQRRPILPYGVPRRDTKTRVIIASIMIATIACSAAGYKYCRHEWPAWERRYWVYRCCHTKAPRNQVAHGVNEYWYKLSLDGVPTDYITVFCHEIKAHNGTRRLVIIDADHMARRLFHRAPLSEPPNHYVSFICWVWDPAVLRKSGDSNSASWSGVIGEWAIGSGWHCNFLNGQLDPNDESHFSFGYKLDGTHGMIDGRLCDDGSVNLKIRDGPAVPY